MNRIKYCKGYKLTNTEMIDYSKGSNKNITMMLESFYSIAKFLNEDASDGNWHDGAICDYKINANTATLIYRAM